MDAVSKMRKLDSTLIFIDNNGLKTIKFLSKSAKNTNSKKILDTLHNLGEISDDQYVSFNELLESLEFGKIAIRNRINELKKAEAVTICSGRSIFGKASPPRLEVLTVKPLSEIKVIDKTNSIKSTAGRKAAKIIHKNLSDQNVYVPASYRDSGISTQSYQYPLSNEINQIVAAGTSITKRKERLIQTNEGVHLNFAESIYGVINDFDIQVINILFKITIAYLESLPDHLQQSVNPTVRIPVWIEDILELKGLPDTTVYREKVSDSLLRIETTFYKIYKGKVSTGEYNDSDVNQLFRFLSDLIVLSKQSEKQNSISTEKNSDFSSIQNDWGSDYPFTCVLLRWNADFYDYIINKKAFFSLNHLSHKIPPTLYALYSALRIEFFSQNSVFFIDDQKNAHCDLLGLCEFVWPIETLPDLKKLATQVIIDSKRTLNKFPSMISIEMNLDLRLSELKLELFGITIVMLIPRLDQPRLASNLQSKVIISINEKELIEDTGAKYRVNGSNSPTLPSPIYGHIGVSKKNESKRRVLPSISKQVGQHLNNFKIGKYKISFELAGQSFDLSKYNSHDERVQIYGIVSTVISIEVSAVELFFSHALRNVLMIQDLSFGQLDEISRNLNTTKNRVLDYLIPRIRFLTRILSEDFHELRTELSKS